MEQITKSISMEQHIRDALFSDDSGFIKLRNIIYEQGSDPEDKIFQLITVLSGYITSLEVSRRFVKNDQTHNELHDMRNKCVHLMLDVALETDDAIFDRVCKMILEDFKITTTSWRDIIYPDLEKCLAPDGN